MVAWLHAGHTLTHRLYKARTLVTKDAGEDALLDGASGGCCVWCVRECVHVCARVCVKSIMTRQHILDPCHSECTRLYGTRLLP